MKPEKATEVGSWWSANPMTYGDAHGQAVHRGEEHAFGDDALFRNADAKLYSWNRPLHGKVPFDRIFPYERFRGKRVLEIGCGMGAMASLWAGQGATVHAVDLAPFSVEMTRRRFAASGLAGEIVEADGRALPFEDGNFDYVYSFGVLHHSPDLTQSLREMMRVLKVGGEFGLMLYHRHSFYYWWRVCYHEGLVHNESDFLDPVSLSSRYTDASEAEGNPHTWPVSRSDVRGRLGPYATDLEFRLWGQDVRAMFNMMLPGLGRLPTWMLKPWARRWGWSLWASGTRA